MPALPPVPSVLRYTATWSYGSDLDVVSRFFIRYGGTAPTTAQLVTHAGAAFAAIDTHMVSLWSTQVFQTALEVVDLTSPSAAIGTQTGSTQGTRSGGMLSANNCALINMQIARRYRGGKPRIYFPFGVTTDVGTPQQWTSAFTTAVQTGWNATISAIFSGAWTGAGTMSWGNVSYYEGFASVQNPVTKRWRNIPTPRTTPLFDPSLSFTVNPKVGSQRRRVAA